MTPTTPDVAVPIAALPRSRLVGFVLLTAAILLGAATTVMGHRMSGMWFGEDGPAFAAIAVAAGLVPAFAGLEAWRRGRRRTGLLLVAMALAWDVSSWAYPTIGSSILFTIGLALGSLWPAIAFHLLTVVSAGGRPVRAAEMITGAGYAIFGLALGVIPALTFDPEATLCGLCPANHLLVVQSDPVAAASGEIGSVVGVAWVPVAIIWLVLHIRTLGPASRRLQAPVTLAGAVLLALVGAELLRDIYAAPPPTDPLIHLLRLAQGIGLVAVALGIDLEWLESRRAKGRIAAVVADLSHAPSPGGLKDALAALLGDPELRIAYPIESARTVDVHGHAVPVGERAGRHVTPIVRDDEVLALIDHRSDVLDDPQRIDDVIGVARLGLEYERLQAVSRAQLEDLRDARKRIVASGDEARRRLERDLHDGAQQRLLTLAIRLRITRSKVPESARVIDEVLGAVDIALDELRDVAHGLYPSILADAGLAAAVEGLADGAPVAVTLQELPEGRLDASVEATAYHVIAETLRTATGPISIRCAIDAGSLSVEITGANPPPDVAEDLADRVGASDGTIDRRLTVNDVATLRAEIPCAL